MSRISSQSFKVNSDLEQLVEISNTSLSVSDSTAQGSLSTIAGAVSGTEMQVDIVSSTGTLNVSDSTAQGSLSTIAGAITASVMAVSDSSAQSSLSTLAGAVSGSEVQVDIVSAPTLNVSDSTAQGSLSTLAGAVSGSEFQCDIVSSSEIDVDLANVGGSSIALGSTTSASCIPVVIASDQAAISVNTTNANNSGSHNNLVDNASKSSGDFSNAIDTRKAKNIFIFGNTTDTSSNEIEIHVSADDTNYYKYNYGVYPDSSGDFSERINGAAINYIKIKFTNTTAATVNASLTFN